MPSAALTSSPDSLSALKVPTLTGSNTVKPLAGDPGSENRENLVYSEGRRDSHSRVPPSTWYDAVNSLGRCDNRVRPLEGATRIL